MENTQNSPELEDQNYKLINFLLFFMVLSPLVFILILFKLDRIDSSNGDPIVSKIFIDLSSYIDLFFIIFLGISILIIFTTYWFALPKAMKKYQDKGYNFSYLTFVLMFASNDLIVAFGFFIGNLSLGINHQVDWLKFLLLLGIGWTQMIYLYGWKIPKDYRKFSFKSSKK